MKAYKLVRQLKNGDLVPLFINKKEPFKLGEWMSANYYPTQGFAPRLGFHCCVQPIAPHLKEILKSGQKRVWVEVEVQEFSYYNRPESQGGKWILAKRMKVNKIME